MEIRKDKRLNRCAVCGGEPEIKEGWDTLQVECKCGNKGKSFFGDYDDEAFMFLEYGAAAITDWNERQDKISIEKRQEKKTRRNR